MFKFGIETCAACTPPPFHNSHHPPHLIMDIENQGTTAEFNQEMGTMIDRHNQSVPQLQYHQPQLFFSNGNGGVIDENANKWCDIEVWFKFLLALYALSQVERLMYYVGESDGGTSMNIFLAIVTIGGGFVMIAVRSKSLHVLKQQLSRFEESVNAQNARIIEAMSTMATASQMEAQTEEIRVLITQNLLWR